ncbi:MAG: transposase [Trichodesmium sp. MO_231.B1]|nr:transposase [Trichodesmium sp. MO_231.B1]
MEEQGSWLSRQLHLGVNEAIGEIVAGVVTTKDISDDQVLCDLLDGVEGEIAQVSGDGAYHKCKWFELARHKGAKITIAPRKNPVPQGNMVTVEVLPILEMKT